MTRHWFGEVVFLPEVVPETGGSGAHFNVDELFKARFFFCFFFSKPHYQAKDRRRVKAITSGW